MRNKPAKKSSVSTYIASRIIAAAAVIATIAVAIALNWDHFAVLHPKGQIADRQYDLIVFATVLSCVIVIPVLIMTFAIAWKYREKNKDPKVQAAYRPDWDHSRKLETIWWGIPCAIILVLAVVTWNSSHALDPAKPIQQAENHPITIQVIALQWKWLFIYPEQHIATVNYVQFPEQTPVNFEITSDAPMNSFWIPELGGQVYAMSGMNTKLHLMADSTGVYGGSSANLSGKGFADMKFQARSSSLDNFNAWVTSVKKSSFNLDASTYAHLAQPGSNNQTMYYASVPYGLYDTVIDTYMGSDMQGMEH